LIVPDNPRAMIADPDHYEPRAGDTVLDFARHYGTSFPPARVYRPQDKPKVEVAVQVVERWIMARLRHHRFASVQSVDDAIGPLLKNLNERPFQKLPECRANSTTTDKEIYNRHRATPKPPESVKFPKSAVTFAEIRNSHT
jgi:hypothetical protein